MPKAFIISTGTELLSSSMSDTNSEFLRRELVDMGFDIIGRMVVGDAEDGLKTAFEAGWALADLIISTGGLGPTFDDLTRTAASTTAGVALEMREDVASQIRAFFAGIGRKMPASNLRQAMFPIGADVLNNLKGTAAGTYLSKDGKTLILLPGPPHEMENMFLNEAKPKLQHDYQAFLPVHARQFIKTFGLGESQLEERIQDLIVNSEAIEMGILASNTEVMVKILARNQDAIPQMESLTGQIVERLKGYVFSLNEEDNIETRAVELLKKNHHSLSIAESCTGGLLSRMITNVPGASEVFWGSVVSYNNYAKMRFLGVQEATLQSYGAVSPETAGEMAHGIKNVSECDWGISITGIAGPGGGSAEKPVGLVYVACIGPGVEQVKKLTIGGDRERIRNFAARSALNMLISCLHE